MGRNLRQAAEKDHANSEKELLRVSFEYIDWTTDIFFLHGLEADFYRRLFACLQTVQSTTEAQLSRQNHSSLSCKAIFKTETGTHSSFPAPVVARIKGKLAKERPDEDAETEAHRIAASAFEVSMGKNQGRLHGFLWNKTFNLVWFDPAHNLYPGIHKVKAHKDFATIRCGSHEELLRLRQENARVVHEYNEVFEEFVGK